MGFFSWHVAGAAKAYLSISFCKDNQRTADETKTIWPYPV
jgi:hypothetical protein